LAQCADAGVKPLLEGPDWGLLDRRSAIGGQVLRIQTASGPLGELFLPVFGEHMAHNAAQAVAAVQALTGPLKPAIIAQGLAAVQAPARLEVVRRSPLVILDTFHNPHGAASAIAGVRESFEVEPLIAVVAAMADKDVDGVLAVLSDTVSHLVVTSMPDLSRALSVDELAEKASSHWDSDHVTCVADVPEALEEAFRIADSYARGAGVLIAGSVVLAGRARAILRPDGTMLDAPQTAIVETPDLSEDQVKAMEGHQLEPLPDDYMSDDGGW